MKIRLTRMTAGLVVGVTAAVVLASVVGAYLYSLHHFQTLLDAARSGALAQGELMRAAFEHQMVEKDRSLIDVMVGKFSEEARIENVMILDRQGRIRYTGEPTDTRRELHIESPTCQACHRLPAADRTTSQVIESGEGTLLRTVLPLRNREACHPCHDPSHRINGVLIVDLDAGEIRATMNRDLRWMAAGSAGLALLLVIALAIVLRVVVLRRLQRFETTARLIASGDLDQRVPVRGSDTLAWLGQEFNTMADAMAKLLRDVRDQREQLETVINGIDDGIVVLDVERKVIAANDAFLQRVGNTRDRAIGSRCHDAVSGHCGAADCPTRACMASGRSQVRICERRAADGTRIWEEVSASPIRRSSGEIVQIVEVWRDISRRREAEARLAESHRLASLGMLASGFSHELNTPLATILTCLEGIQRTAGEAQRGDSAALERIAESASIAREQLLRCRGTTQHFLRLSRGQGSHADLVDLAGAIAAVARLVEPTARKYSVAVETGPTPTGLHLRVDEAELQQVLLNLLINAVLACEPGGRVRIEAGGEDPVRIRVNDDGSGIPADRLEQIFEPFFSGRRGGTGLGLFLSLDIVRQWGGDIQVDSAPGAGSTFEVTIPGEGTSVPDGADG